MTRNTSHTFLFVIAFILTIPITAQGQNSYDRLKDEINFFNEAAKQMPGCERTKFSLPNNNLKDRMTLLETTGQLANMYQNGRCCQINLDKALGLYALAIEFGNEDKKISPATSDIVDLKVKGFIAPKIAEIKDIKKKQIAQAEFADKQAREKKELERQTKAKQDSDQTLVVAYVKQLDIILKDISESLSKGDLKQISVDRFEEIFVDIDKNITAEPSSQYYEANKNLALVYTEKVLTLTKIYDSLMPSKNAPDALQEVSAENPVERRPATKQDLPIDQSKVMPINQEPKGDIDHETTKSVDQKSRVSIAANEVYNKISGHVIAILAFLIIALIVLGIYFGISDKAVFYYDSNDLFVSLVPFISLAILYIVAILDESKIYSISLLVISLVGIIYVSYRTIMFNNFNYKIAIPVVFAKIFLSATIVFKFIELIFPSNKQSASQRLSNVIIFSAASFLSAKLINGHRVYEKNGWIADD